MCAEKKSPWKRTKRKEKTYNKTEPIAPQTETLLITLLQNYLQNIMALIS